MKTPEPPATDMDETTLGLGLLMEAAQAHQALAESSLNALQGQVRGLDVMLRDQVQQVLSEGLWAVTQECSRATRSLQSLRRVVGARAMLWAVATAGLCAALLLVAAQWLLPSPEEMIRLRAHRDELAAAITELQRRGAGIDWRRCGETHRLCVRIDTGTPAFGPLGDFRIVADQ